jgi:hypothetical protein
VLPLLLFLPAKLVELFCCCGSTALVFVERVVELCACAAEGSRLSQLS